jgi:lipoprotein-anchoring transpeptidase ErfK/SrfK
MSRWNSAAASGLALLISLSILVAPANAGGRQGNYVYAPPPGMSITDGTPRHALMLRSKVRLHPMHLRQVVPFSNSEKPGTLIVDTGSHFLYLVLGKGRAMRYGIGVAKDGFEWSGTHRVSNKREWPDWTPPAEMLKRRPDLPRHMAGGPSNPMGARALYIGSTLYRIHGTTEPWSIGQNVSSGCIRMTNEDVTDLYARVKIGTKVVVL